MKRQRGISLIELIVAIAIILTVFAIVFPAYSSVRKSSKKVATISNLRQIHLAALIYQGNENGGGIYGSLEAMRLPDLDDLVADKSVFSLFKSPCGYHPTNKTETGVIYFPGFHEDFATESFEFKENLIVVMDMHCTDSSIELGYSAEKKLGIGVLLSGQLAVHNKGGRFTDPFWWAEPMP